MGQGFVENNTFIKTILSKYHINYSFYQFVSFNLNIFVELKKTHTLYVNLCSLLSFFTKFPLWIRSEVKRGQPNKKRRNNNKQQQQNNAL